ncbi:MAG: DUF2461 domain-containing protein [Proteobacteria bacterium]|nr:DUF2461 domain-containing protein [Pseudomonadota bacterium]MDA1058385.1 DUF2461 domain-containing protein [Pseudomonadota bacterium]
MATTFNGFPKDATTFLKGLAKNNKKEWFDAHRAEYENGLLEPCKDFVAAIGPKLAKIAPDIHAVPKVTGSIMRINRDTRFAKDKTPYKTYMGLWFWQGAGRSRECPGFYFGIGGDELTLGAGMHMFGPKQLDAYRKALVDPKKGPAARKAFDKIAKLKGIDIGGAHYKKVPRGFDPDHANADLLKHNALYFGFTTKVPKELFTAQATDYCAKVYKEVWPLQQWLVAAIG